MKALKVARRGNVSADGRTMTEAKAKLNSMVDHLCETANSHTIEFRFGATLIVWPEDSGFAYSIVFPDEPREHGKRKYSSCHFQAADILAAICQARFHAAQTLWTENTADDAAHIEAAGLTTEQARDELSGWIAWQREHIAARVGGFEIAPSGSGFKLIDRAEFNNWGTLSDTFPDREAATAYAEAADKFKRGGSCLPLRRIWHGDSVTV